LSLLKSLLGENGKMCIAVPDATRFAECVESPYQYFSVEHINFFTSRSLESLLATVGMELQSCEKSTALLGVFKEPIIQGLFTTGAAAVPTLGDPDGPAHLARYVENSRQRQNALLSSIEDFVAPNERIIVWGAGSLTMHLLSDPRFARLNIVAFVDANPNYWDKTIRGVAVIAPALVSTHEEKILIVSYSYEDEICAEIRNRYKLHNTIVRLFESANH
jgi:hypothetical protein